MSKNFASVAELTCPVPLPSHSHTILLGHGSGGRLSAELLQDVILPALADPALAQLNDQAVVNINHQRIAFTTDSFVVKPLFFPGGDIGSLAVHGTINDLAVGGATPLFLSAALIVEEGFPIEDLRRIMLSIKAAATSAGVRVVTGDTKVVERGKGDGVFITTTGIGVVPEGVEMSSDQARPGDKILLSGPIGDHGIAILSKREGIEFETAVQSDSAPLHTLVAAILKSGNGIRCMRDPTRGGLSSALNEIAARSHVSMEIEERSIPVRDEVAGACELLGLDPLYVANEGKLIAIVDSLQADNVLTAMKSHSLGAEAEIIGTVKMSTPPMVTMRTHLGTTRIVDMLSGDQLPRIC